MLQANLVTSAQAHMITWQRGGRANQTNHMVLRQVPKQEVVNIQLRVAGGKRKKPVLGFEPRSPAPHGCSPPLERLGVLPITPHRLVGV